MSRLSVFTESAPGVDRIWLDNYALVSGLNYQTTYPGGDSQASWQITLDPRAQHRAWTYGRRVGICSGASEIWHGYMDNPVRGATWTMNAIGVAALAKQYAALAATSGNALNLNEVVDAAIARGLPFTRAASLPSLANGTAPSASLMVDQALDQVAAGQTVETYWSVDTWGALSMGAAPASPSRVILATTSGGGRNLDGFVTDVYVVYQSATGVTSNDHRAVASRPYGRFEAVDDQTALGLIPASQADTLGDGFLARNSARLRFTDTFTLQKGQFLRLQGRAIPLATVRAGFLANVLITDPDTAGEVTLGQIPQVLIGGTSYDADSETLTLTPVYSAQDNLTALLGAGSLVS